MLEGVVMDGCDSGRVDDSASPLWRMKDGGGDGWMKVGMDGCVRRCGDGCIRGGAGCDSGCVEGYALPLWQWHHKIR